MRIPPSIARATRRSLTTTASRSQPRPPPFPTTSQCPPSTCSCAPTPALDIDHTSPLNGAITAYQEQILVCTGKDDWASRIEDDNDGQNLAGYLKNTFFGRGGEMVDPFWNVSILNSSFQSSRPKSTEQGSTSVYLVPSFKYIPHIKDGDHEDAKAMLKGWVLPKELHPAYEKTPEMKPDDPERLLRADSFRSRLAGVRDVDEVLVLICGHGGRDERCGIYGPLLRTEFEDKLEKVGGWAVQKHPPETSPSASSTLGQEDKSARVGLISHIGGHKFAGNVILYIPPQATLENGQRHPLAGMGVWYGRVEPKHVEGIVRETIGQGRVIEELYRGAIDAERRIVRLDTGEGLKKRKVDK